MNIFDKPYYPLAYFNYEVYVHCPKCREIGLVKADKEVEPYKRDKTARFHCLACGHLAGNPKSWLGYYVGYVGLHYKGRACGNCGSTIHKEFPLTKIPYQEGMVKCVICQQERSYQITWYPYRGELPIDPYFGLDLYFQKRVKQGNLWVYNQEHSEYLRDYVNATIRDRELFGLYAMVARLPQFIKSKKNKETVTKHLEEFENELSKQLSKKVG
jgi:hypothetical protein